MEYNITSHTQKYYNNSDLLSIKNPLNIQGSCGKIQGDLPVNISSPMQRQTLCSFAGGFGMPRASKDLSCLLIDISEFSLSCSDTWKTTFQTAGKGLWWDKEDT